MYIKDLDSLYNDYSISIRKPDNNCPLIQSIIKDLKKSKMAKELIERYEFEPLRLKLLLIKEKLQLYQECIIQRKK